ncbi:hypothetical protein [Luteimonas saliphila]|uniref:hypothetical protein n=1 Tax=Luteimonas saliphila TaxID=2804919 RepID=UPI001EE279FD|nr:hypothetical protein [Luteimonas saliphila]
MRRQSSGCATRTETPAAPDARRLVTLLRDENLDAAIEAGLMACTDDALRGLDEPSRALLVETQRRLQVAWDARARYQARQMRLARRKAERDARRAASLAPAAQPDRGAPATAATPSLPAAAAAALARAKARAGSS